MIGIRARFYRAKLNKEKLEKENGSGNSNGNDELDNLYDEMKNIA